VPPAAIAAAPEVGFEQMDAVFRAIGELNTDMRAALLLRDVVGLSYNEIAEALAQNRDPVSKVLDTAALLSKSVRSARGERRLEAP